MGLFSKNKDDEVIRKRVRIERSEHKRQDEIERILAYVIPAVVLIVVCLVIKIFDLGH